MYEVRISLCTLASSSHSQSEQWPARPAYEASDPQAPSAYNCGSVLPLILAVIRGASSGRTDTRPRRRCGGVPTGNCQINLRREGTRDGRQIYQELKLTPYSKTKESKTVVRGCREGLKGRGMRDTARNRRGVKDGSIRERPSFDQHPGAN